MTNVSLHIRIHEEVAEMLRDAAYWERRQVSSLIQQWVEDGLTKSIQERGKTYPQRKGNVPRGPKWK